MIAASQPPSSANGLRPAHRPAFAPTVRSAVTRREALGHGRWSTGRGWGHTDKPEAANGALGGASSYHRFRTAARLEMGKVPARQVSRPGRVMVRHLRMPGGHRRGPSLDLLPLEVRQFGNRVTQLMGEDRQLVPATCFLLSFELGEGPDPTLLTLPQVYDRHRRRLKQEARF